MIRRFLFARVAPVALLVGPAMIGLPARAGGAFVLGALAGLAVVLPVALALRLVPLRTVLGWPLWLAGVALRLLWRGRRVA